jgi:uncharacterized protein YbcI
MSGLKKQRGETKIVRLMITQTQAEFLRKEAKRMKVSVSRAMLIFLFDGRLTPVA